MIQLNIHEAKNNLYQYLDRLLGGEVILLCRRNVPIAEIRAVAPKRTEPRPIGLARGQIDLPAGFFDALPEDILEAFQGRSA